MPPTRPPGPPAAEPETPAFSIVIPAFNEASAIRGVLEALRAAHPDAEVLVVDDGSTDDTAGEARREPGVEVVVHPENRGYGAALKTALRRCRAPVVVWFDADGQHPAEEIAALVGPVARDELDAHFGSREAGSVQVLGRVPGKWLLRRVAQLVARRPIPDLNCGFRAFRTHVVRRYLHLLPDGFSASATTTLLMIKRGYRVGFLPIRAAPRIGTSTVRLSDGLNTLVLLLRIMLLFDSFLFFTVLAILQVVPAFVYSLWLALTVRLGVPTLGAIVFISGCMTFFIGVVSNQVNELRQELFESRPDWEA